MPIGILSGDMAFEFQAALAWHMKRHETKIVDLVKGTGVSRDVINKLLGRNNASTNVENAVLIAAYYGKTVNQFLLRQDVEPSTQLANLFDMLPPSDVPLVQAQILGIIRMRGERQSQ